MGASFSSEKPLQAATLGDSEEHVSPRSIADDEFNKPPGDKGKAKEEEEGVHKGKAKEEEEGVHKEASKEDQKEKEKKKKRYRMRPDDVEMILNFGHELEFPNTTAIDRLATEEGGVYADLRSSIHAAQAFVLHSLPYDDNIRAIQEKVRQELLTKGYATYGATDDDEEEYVATDDDEEDEEDQQQGGQGQTTHGPADGVAWPPEGVPRLN